MSLERVLKTLESFGLSRVESEVYVYLAKIGPSRAINLVCGLRMTKQELYSVLNSLMRKGIVKSRPEHTALFYALAFEELLNRFMQLGFEQTKTIKDTKQELIKNWKDLIRQKNS